MIDFGAVYAAFGGRMNRHDCWELCRGTHRCCAEQDLALMPGEGEYLRSKGVAASDDVLHCAGRKSCYQDLRPIVCRTFPLHPDHDGRMMAHTGCSQHPWASWKFIHETERAWATLLADPDGRTWATRMRGMIWRHWWEVPADQIRREFAEGYVDNFGQYTNTEIARRLLTWGFIRPGQRALDCGCGSGVTVAMLREAGVEAWGVEVNRSLIERSVARSHCYEMDMRDLSSFHNGEVDLAYSVDVLEHLPDYGLAIAEMLRVGRQAYIQVTTSEDEGSLYEDPTHCVFMSSAEWRAAIEMQARILAEPRMGGFLICAGERQ